MQHDETYRFYVTVHARPANAVAGQTIEIAGRKARPLVIDRQALGTTTFSCSFEEAIAALAALPRMYCEPDGSFVWTSAQGEPDWQVDGNLYDRNDRLLFVDVKGNCPRDAFDRFLQALGWPAAPLMFQLTREAVFLDEAEFRHWAMSPGADYSTGTRPIE